MVKKVVDGVLVDLTPAELADYNYRLANPDADTPAAPPGPPTLAASAFGIKVANGDIAGIGAGYNILAAMYFGPGMIMIMYVTPLPSSNDYLLFNGGGGASFEVADTDHQTYAVVQAKIGGVEADPVEPFAVQVYCFAPA